MRTEYQVPNFRLGNYATGNYFGKCDICAEEFIGDKRARSCLPCALKAVEGLQAELDRIKGENRAMVTEGPHRVAFSKLQARITELEGKL
jgi:hypothetical protein